jgi:hypothetical protein
LCGSPERLRISPASAASSQSAAASRSLAPPPTDLQWAVRSAERKEELESAAHFAERQLHILDLDDLAGADEAFGRLRQRILSDYDLPTPTW